MRAVLENLFRASLVAALAFVLVAPVSAWADHHEKPEGVRGEILAWIEDAEDKLLQLAEATPEDKYTWRPMEGVRSQGEVFLHAAAANYGLPTFWGVKAPEGFTFQGFEQSKTTKADITQTLKDSFEHVKKGMLSLSEEEFTKDVTLFGGLETTVRGGYLLILSHNHEHLGQSIAYARSNEIVPPWSAKQGGGDGDGGEE